MLSIFHGLIGLIGLACSAVLTFGLLAERLEEPPPSLVADSWLAEREGESADWDGEDQVPEAGEQPLAADNGSESPKRVRRVLRVTAYHDKGITAAGVRTAPGQCAAPVDVPFGSQIHIKALGWTFVVTDRTHRRFRHNTVDIFMPDREMCRKFGRRYLECEIRLPDKRHG